MSLIQNVDARIDAIDLKILKEMEADGRQSASSLAKKIGISRAYASRRLQRLLEERITRIVAFTNPRVLGYRAFVIIGIRVSPGQLNSVADRVGALPNVHLVVISAGRHDVIIWTMFADTTDLAGFLMEELGNIPGIDSTETTMVVDWRKMSFAYLTASSEEAAGRDERGWADFRRSVVQNSGVAVDEMDLMILRELEADGRKPVSYIARVLGTSRANVSSRLQRISDQRVARVVAHTSPLALGYRIFAIIGIKASPGNINAVADRLCSLSNVYWVAMVAGRHDIIIWTMFSGPTDLSGFLGNELGAIPGITSTETMIALELKKMSFPFLASSYLQARAVR